MPTSLQLTQAQVDQLATLRIQANSMAPDAKAAWVPFYQYLAQTIRNTVLPKGTTAVTAEDVVAVRSGGLLPENQLQTMVWLMGGAQVNSDSGAFSKVIREYNLREGQLRGKIFSSSELQRASNRVGINMAAQILDGGRGSTNGAVPTVNEIGERDLNGVRDVLYPGNLFQSDPTYLNQAWPSVVMPNIFDQVQSVINNAGKAGMRR